MLLLLLLLLLLYRAGSRWQISGGQLEREMNRVAPSHRTDSITRHA